MILLLILLASINLALLIPAATYAAEIVASLLPGGRPAKSPVDQRPSVTIIIPAHQEEDGIGPTVTALRTQLRPGDRLLVVADNCTDETAAQARKAGAEVIERTDPARRGKGFALDFGVRHIEAAPTPIVLIIDADCTLEPGCVDELAASAASSGRPVQGRYLMAVPPDGGIHLRVAELAFLIKNQVRPAGLHRLGLPCHLTGSGMAFPWPIIRDANLAHASLVEDMKLGIDLALAGTPPLYCADAHINSYFPYSDAGAASQRSRWEEGHLGMIALAFRNLPRAFASRSLNSIALTLDILVPPLTLLLLLVAATFIVTAAASLLFGLDGFALMIATVNVLLLGISTLTAWYAFGRKALPARALFSILPFVLGKLKLYGGMATGTRSGSWIRTDRGGPDSPKP